MSDVTSKLKLEKYSDLVIVGIPKDVTEFDDLDFSNSWKKSDFLFTFVFSLEEMKEVLEMVDIKNFMTDKGYLYLAYPKLSTKKYENKIHRDDIFPFLKVDEETGQIANLDLKFSNMMAFNDDFTMIGIKRNSTNLRKRTS
ncbi:MAG: hypothetical protein LBM27_04665 [Lactobacillaceae bacterium]|jgi:hypothetical protein|nr:hypothetical protein [Lactobacillaceae bacterium]